MTDEALTDYIVRNIRLLMVSLAISRIVQPPTELPATWRCRT